MKISEIPFEITDWSDVEPIRHAGLSGEALWRTRHVGPEGNRIRIRMVEYTPGYVADHWCQKGHVLLVLEGELETVLADGRVFKLKGGMSYQVADDAEPHMSRTTTGARLFIVD
jgi:quercetin dioxygenase-like cupin family protein